MTFGDEVHELGRAIRDRQLEDFERRADGDRNERGDPRHGPRQGAGKLVAERAQREDLQDAERTRMLELVDREIEREWRAGVRNSAEHEDDCRPDEGWQLRR